MLEQWLRPWGRSRLRRGLLQSSYLSFLRGNPAALSFCLLWMCGSGLGQTFFISMFQPYWLVNLGLNQGSIGLLYAAATLGSGLLLRGLGRWVDASATAQVVWLAGGGLAAA